MELGGRREFGERSGFFLRISSLYRGREKKEEEREDGEAAMKERTKAMGNQRRARTKEKVSRGRKQKYDGDFSFFSFLFY